MQDFLGTIKFSPGNFIADMVLKKKIHSTLLYETWEVLKQEEYVRKPLLAHIFKYNLGSQFPLKPDDLNLFCEKILSYNQSIKFKEVKLRALPCYNSQVYTQRLPGGSVSYLLFEMPNAGFRIDHVCSPFSSGERVCRYMIKDFTKGWLESVLYSQNSKDSLDVNFVLAQNGIYFGTLPNVRKQLNETNSSLRNFLKKEKTDKNAENENYRHFVTIAYPKAFSPESLVPPKKEKNNEKEKIKEVKNNSTLSTESNNATALLKITKDKQFMVQFGKFLINMFKGLDNTTNIPPPSPDDNFDPAEIVFNNVTDVFLNLNTKKNGNFSTFRADEYFGVPEKYVPTVNAFLEKTLTTQKALKEMDDMLKDSFYEFIFKSVMFDLTNEKQFATIESMLKHKFVLNKIDMNKVRSDTSFEK
jgi:hypothetical protein